MCAYRKATWRWNSQTLPVNAVNLLLAFSKQVFLWSCDLIVKWHRILYKICNNNDVLNRLKLNSYKNLPLDPRTWSKNIFSEIVTSRRLPSPSASNIWILIRSSALRFSQGKFINMKTAYQLDIQVTLLRGALKPFCTFLPIFSNIRCNRNGSQFNNCIIKPLQKPSVVWTVFKLASADLRVCHFPL